MTAEALVNYVMNDRTLHGHVTYYIGRLRNELDKAARLLAKENAGWHDDPAADEYADFHAPADVQFPRNIRDKAIKALVAHYLSEMAIQNS